ncbi:MAG: hypothetical protein ACJ8F3_09095 [Xanthobacteraceae bacterium]
MAGRQGSLADAGLCLANTRPRLLHQPRKLAWDGQGTLLLTTHLDREALPVRGPMLLGPDEGVIIKLRD